MPVARTEEGVYMKRLLVLVLGAGLIAGLVAVALSRGSADAARHGSLLRGAVGADFDAQLPAGSPVGADFGVDVSLPRRAGNALGDNDVYIALRWKNGGGQTIPTTSDTSPRCTGTLARPTAPRGKVCIYVAGGDNAANVSGYSVRPGTDQSRYGFKLKWDAMHNGDTFIDAVWAYRYP
jgi:hypothetical protein